MRQKTGYFRWIICALLFLSSTMMYMDRNVMSILKPTILTWQGWSEMHYAQIISLFQLAYAGAMLLAGAFIDRIGIKKGFLIAIIFWSLAAMGHAISGAVVSFLIFRTLLGFAEAANFPASIKAVAEWFPRRHRALATGILNSGTNVGAVVTPFALAWILGTFGSWKWAFILLGVLGAVWIVLWSLIYRRPEVHPLVSKEELAYIRSETEEKAEKTPWAPLFKYRQTWAFAAGKAITDPVWWIWLFWLPGFLKFKFHVNIKEMGPPLLVIYSMASVGSVFGGWISAFLMKHGLGANPARKFAMLFCACCVIPVFFASTTTHLWTAVWLLGLACGAHQGWAANLFTLTSDMFPKRAVASVVGIGGAAGGITGFLTSNLLGAVLNKNPGNYLPVFVGASLIYICAFVVVQILVPRLEPARL